MIFGEFKCVFVVLASIWKPCMFFMSAYRIYIGKPDSSSRADGRTAQCPCLSGRWGRTENCKGGFLQRQIICSSLRVILFFNPLNPCLHTHPFTWGYPPGFFPMEAHFSPGTMRSIKDHGSACIRMQFTRWMNEVAREGSISTVNECKSATLSMGR